MSELKVVEQEQVAATAADQEASAALSVGYNRVKGEPVEAKTTPEVVVEKPAAGAKPAEATKTDEVVPDPWEGVSPVIKEQFGELGKRFDAVMHHLKSTDGRIGAVQKALSSAQAATTKAGADAPTAQQIQSAVVTPEKWKKLEEDFPSWAEALSERLAADRAAITAEIKGAIPKPVDVASFKQAVITEFDTKVDEAEERAFVRLTHPTWKKDIRTPEFSAWFYAGGPVQEAAEIDRLKAEAKQLYSEREPAAANELIRQAQEIESLWPRQYPKWWAERGALADSHKSEDAIKIIDAFKASKKPSAPSSDPARKQQNQQRLATVVAPKQANSGGPSALPDEAGLNVGYNRVRRA